MRSGMNHLCIPYKQEIDMNDCNLQQKNYNSNYIPNCNYNRPYNFESILSCLHSKGEILEKTIFILENNKILKRRPSENEKSRIRAGSTFFYSTGIFYKSFIAKKKDENIKKEDEIKNIESKNNFENFNNPAFDDQEGVNIMFNSENEENNQEFLKKRIIYRWTDSHSWSPTRQCGVFTVYIQQEYRKLVKKIVGVEILIKKKEFIRIKDEIFKFYQIELNDIQKVQELNENLSSRKEFDDLIVLDALQIVNYTTVHDELEEKCCLKYTVNNFKKNEENNQFKNNYLQFQVNLQIILKNLLGFENVIKNESKNNSKNEKIDIILKIKSRKPTNTKTSSFLKRYAVMKKKQYYSFVDENNKF